MSVSVDVNRKVDEESRQQRFRRVLKYETRKIMGHVTRRGSSGHTAYLDGATRKRVRLLARKTARQAAKFA